MVLWSAANEDMIYMLCSHPSITELFQKSVYSCDGTPPRQHSPITWHYPISFSHRAFSLRRSLGVDLSQGNHDVSLFATTRIIRTTRKNPSSLVRSAISLATMVSRGVSKGCVTCRQHHIKCDENKPRMQRMAAPRTRMRGLWQEKPPHYGFKMGLFDG